MAIDLQLPLDSGWGYVSSEYGPRKSLNTAAGTTSGFHNGIDFARGSGTPIYAAADGLVIEAGWGGDYGNYVSIRHQDSGPRLSSGYAHLLANSFAVKPNQRVSKGQLLGRVGSTGKSSGAHLHYQNFVDGAHVNPRDFYKQYAKAPAVASGNLSTTQRKVVAHAVANRRLGKASSSALVGEALEPGTVGNFVGWVRGDKVDGNDVWFVGTSGDFFWSGGFEGGANTSGLTDLNPAQGMKANQRRTTTDLRARTDTNTSATVAKMVAVNSVISLSGWKHGESVSGETRWAREESSGTWLSLLYLEPRNTDGIADLNPKAPAPAPTPSPNPNPAPTPSPVETEAQIEARNTPNLVTPSVDDFPKWIRFETVLDPEGQLPDVNTHWSAYYKRPYAPIESHVHWWNSPGQGGTHDGNVNHIKNTQYLSVNFVVSEKRITLMVPLNKLALTTGQRNPDAWKSENDPTLSEWQYKTMGYLHYIVEKLNPSLVNEPIRLHKEFSATGCSEIDTGKVRAYAEAFRSGALEVATGLPKPIVSLPETTPPTPVPTPLPDTVSIPRSFLEGLPGEFRALAQDLDEFLV